MIQIKAQDSDSEMTKGLVPRTLFKLGKMTTCEAWITRGMSSALSAGNF